MKDYQALGHMEPIPQSESDKKEAYYLPHVGVLKDTSSTTRLLGY